MENTGHLHVLQERVESLEKDGRLRLLQRSLGHTHSRDSAIDTDLQVLSSYSELIRKV